MSDITLFHLLSAGWWILQLLLPALIAMNKWSSSFGLRATLAVLGSWGIIVIYTLYIYNPVGIAAGIVQGLDNPQMLYDNNTVVSATIGGWFYPILVVMLCKVWFRLRTRAQQDVQIITR